MYKSNANNVRCFTGYHKAEGFGFRGNKYQSGITAVLDLWQGIGFNDKYKSTWNYTKSTKSKLWASIIKWFK